MLAQKIGILGANSKIAQDLIYNLFKKANHELYLFGRATDQIKKWIDTMGITATICSYDRLDYDVYKFDSIINFIGVGNPSKAVRIGASIIEITEKFDNLALLYTRNSGCKYINLSSGAVFGGDFKDPANYKTQSTIEINSLKSHDWYGIAKLYSECKHRALTDLSIVDLRVFNYIGPSTDINDQFLITDIYRSINSQELFETSGDDIVRDFLSDQEFFKIIDLILNEPRPINTAFDCYTKSPISKFELLRQLKEVWGLNYEIKDNSFGVNGTGFKSNYYSTNYSLKAYGYLPTNTSLENILRMAEIFCK